MHELAGEPVPPPWWRYGHVWLVIAGPAIVIVACFVTIWLAVTRPDPVLDYAPRRGPSSSDLSRIKPAPTPAQLPALQARNHAASPGAVVKSPPSP